ncbi:hypothetical protein [Actinoplanes sp. RD1]|uniref:hypothetical protein n=1 Tax=Actinoplanes sp. RD1 TaxID=3064538 RepID=UPI0027429001|nr:hypothetical protein [Actinoplanes sp. RD1]
MRKWLYGSAVLGAFLLFGMAPAQADDRPQLPDADVVTPLQSGEGDGPLVPELPVFNQVLGNLGSPAATPSAVPSERPFRGGMRPVAGEDDDFR